MLVLSLVNLKDGAKWRLVPAAMLAAFRAISTVYPWVYGCQVFRSCSLHLDVRFLGNQQVSWIWMLLYLQSGCSFSVLGQGLYPAVPTGIQCICHLRCRCGTTSPLGPTSLGNSQGGSEEETRITSVHCHTWPCVYITCIFSRKSSTICLLFELCSLPHQYL